MTQIPRQPFQGLSRIYRKRMKPRGLVPCGRRDSMVSMPFSEEMMRSSSSGESQSFIARPASQRTGMPEAGLDRRVKMQRRWPESSVRLLAPVDARSNGSEPWRCSCRFFTPSPSGSDSFPEIFGSAFAGLVPSRYSRRLFSQSPPEDHAPSKAHPPPLSHSPASSAHR